MIYKCQECGQELSDYMILHSFDDCYKYTKKRAEAAEARAAVWKQAAKKWYSGEGLDKNLNEYNAMVKHRYEAAEARAEKAKKEVIVYRARSLEYMQKTAELQDEVKRLQKRADAGSHIEQYMRTIETLLYKHQAPEKRWIGGHHAVVELIAEVERLQNLLREWLNTPFFDTEDEWQAWVDEYRPRVQSALGL